VKDGESVPDAAHRVASHFTGKHGKLGAELFQIKHSVTRFRITLRALDYSLATAVSETAERRWVTASDSTGLAMPAAQRKLISLASR
jgi:adenine-specific DNA glycosylase